jgi:hypothetical protein
MSQQPAAQAEQPGQMGCHLHKPHHGKLVYMGQKLAARRSHGLSPYSFELDPWKQLGQSRAEGAT